MQDHNNKETDPRIDIVRENLRMALALRNEKASAVSQGAGLSVNALGTFINGKSSIRYDNLLRVCDRLDVPIGLLHISGAISANRIRLHRILENSSGAEREQIALVLSDMRAGLD